MLDYRIRPIEQCVHTLNYEILPWLVLTVGLNMFWREEEEYGCSGAKAEHKSSRYRLLLLDSILVGIQKFPVWSELYAVVAHMLELVERKALSLVVQDLSRVVTGLMNSCLVPFLLH